MYKALNYLGTLPDETVVYNGHEYTPGNVKFALQVEPNNSDVKRRVSILDPNLTLFTATKRWH
jgi:hydroxyacylglutathione hydrolase